MTILHVSNLRFNRTWYRWLLEKAPPHDLLAIAGNLVDPRAPIPLCEQRDWVLAWLHEYARPTCIASGPEDRTDDPYTNPWRSAPRRGNSAARVCVDDGFVEHDGFAIHCIGHGEMPFDRHADIWIAYRDPRVGRPGREDDDRGGYDDSISISNASAAPIILTGDTMDRLHWQTYSRGTLHLNPGWLPFAPFPNHILLDPVSLACRRVSASGYIPKVEVFGPVDRSVTDIEDSVPTGS